jgi:hypothetical protein
LTEAHCSSCCLHFTSDSAFDRHLAPVQSDDDCYPPETFVKSDGSPLFKIVQRAGGPTWTLAGNNPFATSREHLEAVSVQGVGQWSLTPAERSLRSRLAAHAMHARHDARETTAKAREVFRSSLYEQTDPSLPHEERLRRSDHLRKAHYARMALASAKARRRAS